MILTSATLSCLADWLEAIPDEGGVALIDKASGWTSFDVVAKLRGLTKIRKIGHAGTLDPLATGLLIVCLGKATKTIQGYQDAVKRYEALVRLGATTKTDDAEGDEENLRSTDGVDETHIAAALDKFKGEIDQIPPMYSAIKKNGVRMYKLARKGLEVERSPRRVVIHAMDMLRFENPELALDVTCSKGTYIRSLARDLGEELQCGGYLKALRRTAIGEYTVDKAVTLDQIAAALRATEHDGSTNNAH